MAANSFADNSLKANSPAQGAAAVTPHDSNNITALGGALVYRGLYVGGTGDVAAVLASGDVAIFKAVPAGTLLPIMVVRVNATNTTATNMLALY